jgi:hypothetical protein
MSSYAQNRNSVIPEQLETKVIKFYPNPAVSLINFEFKKGVEKDFSFQIFNFLGKKVLDLKSLTQKMSIPLNEFYRGVYIYQLRDRAGKIVESGKFQVNK